MALALSDRLSGGLVGLLVGDALGVPYEFAPPSDLPASPENRVPSDPRFPPFASGSSAGYLVRRWGAGTLFVVDAGMWFSRPASFFQDASRLVLPGGLHSRPENL